MMLIILLFKKITQPTNNKELMTNNESLDLINLKKELSFATKEPLANNEKISRDSYGS